MMRWKKMGRIFDPSLHRLVNGCKEFAQSPQALVFDHFVRIYFSTRQKNEDTGKFLSHISFVDMNKNLNEVIRISDKRVIELGELGCFDEHGIFPMSPVRHNDTILAYTTGWTRRSSVSVDTGIGLAISEDNGETFTKVGKGPVLTSSLFEPFLVGDGFVRKFNGVFHMWYIYGLRWIDNPIEESARVYKIGHAISSDGISWVKEGKQLITDLLNADECQALPTVAYFDNMYHMFFCYREAIGFRTDKAKGYRIGYAYSSDLTQWTRDDQKGGVMPSQSGWDADMLCYPHIFECDGQIYLLYNGNEFGRQGFGLAILEK